MPGETSAFTEAMSESRVVKGVRGAIEGVQQGNKEYWEIRKSIQERLKWHGGGVYKYHVENMDKITKLLYERPDAGFWDKVKALYFKLAARVGGRMLQIPSALADIPINMLLWLPRKFLPIPNNWFKRMALGASFSSVAAYGGVMGAEKGWKAGVKKVREGASAVVTAPEVASTMLKRRVDHFVDQIKNPHPPGMETKPNVSFKPK